MSLACPLCKQRVTEQDSVDELRGQVDGLQKQLDSLTEWINEQLKGQDGNQQRHDA